MIDKEFGKWTVIGGPYKGSVWLCQCKCGRTGLVRADHLRDEKSTGCLSCGGRNPRFAHVPMELFNRLRTVVKNASNRCTDPIRKEYPNYGGRGIRIEFPDRDSFIEHLLTLPGHDNPTLVLDREDNDGHYKAGNLRFVTRTISTKNRRVVGEVTYFVNHGFARCMKKLRDRGVTVSDIARLYCTQRHVVRNCLKEVLK